MALACCAAGQGADVSLTSANFVELNTWTHVCMTTSKPTIVANKEVSTVTIYKNGACPGCLLASLHACYINYLPSLAALPLPSG